MHKKEKQQLSETDICDLYITPAIKGAGCDQLQQIRREVTLTPGPVVVRGNVSARNKRKKNRADYVLSWEPGIPLAVIETKENSYTVSHGMQQAPGYAEILHLPSSYSSNGDAFASHNKVPAPGELIETELALDAFPSPAVLWQRYKVAERMIADNPLVGVGLNNYRDTMTKYDETGIFVSQIFPNPVHNMFAHVTAEVGIPGGIIFCLLIAAALFENWRSFRRGDRLLSAVGLAVFSALIAFIISAVKEPGSLGSTRPPMRTLFFLYGVTLAISRLRRQKLPVPRN